MATSRTMGHKSIRAFTLLEVLVATVITAVMVALLAQMVGSASLIWNAGNSNTERRQSGRALMDYIAQELRAAMLPLDATAAAPNLQFILNPALVSQPFRNPSALFWQAPTAKNSAGGDLAEFGYFVRWSAGNPPRATLCRFYTDSDDTPNYLVYTQNDWITDSLLNALAPADSASGYLGLLTPNVVGFWARCLDADGSVIAAATTTYDSRLTRKLPSAVEISIVLLDSRTAGIMTSGQQASLAVLVNAAANADACVTQIQAAPDLLPLARGARACTTRVYLENAR